MLLSYKIPVIILTPETQDAKYLNTTIICCDGILRTNSLLLIVVFPAIREVMRWRSSTEAGIICRKYGRKTKVLNQHYFAFSPKELSLLANIQPCHRMTRSPSLFLTSADRIWRSSSPSSTTELPPSNPIGNVRTCHFCYTVSTIFN